MPTKPTTITAAEKRVIKAELRTCKQSLRKVQKDCVAEDGRISREIRKLETARKKLSSTYSRESAAICRRMAILEGRLHS